MAEVYDVALLDLDGVVYVGEHPVPGAPAALGEARERGMRLAYVTNNASRTPLTVGAHLRTLGVDAKDDEVVTSAQAAARLVAEQVPAGSAVLVVGGEGLVVALTELGLRPVFSADEEPAAVVQGFSPDVGWKQLAEGAYALARGLPWVASNLDLTIPTPRGRAPGNGTLVGVLAQASGRRPVAAGKPELPLHAEAVRRSGAQRPLVVGDRLDTDIEGAVRASTDSLLVLTGVTTPAELLRAAPHERPTFVAEGLDGLLVPHPAPQPVAAGWSCGGWTASVSDGALQLDGDGDPMDGLRAACAASWSGPVPTDVAALARLGFAAP
ncbi:HAD-IIA family hydrolase [Motilibacter sp. E257]|uniref:HAD-IIA family hydrolase n=1 Tax=Motilibacter deserti TaxID=2714956 RepID=A0ABX0GUJ8_9ACTN|nr:HAD-IIA family hydrolase [Motilibacter deserti]